MLAAEEGRGRTQERGERSSSWCPADDRSSRRRRASCTWHGASPDEYVVQLTVLGGGDGGPTSWFGPVSEEEYRGRVACRLASCIRIAVTCGVVTEPTVRVVTHAGRGPRAGASSAGSGSGKTVLVRRLIEECALQGVSAIVLDPNNDLLRKYAVSGLVFATQAPNGTAQPDSG